MLSGSRYLLKSYVKHPIEGIPVSSPHHLDVPLKMHHMRHTFYIQITVRLVTLILPPESWMRQCS